MRWADDVADATVAPQDEDGTDDRVRWFDTLPLANVPLVNGKNASLREMYVRLRGAVVRFPNGDQRAPVRPAAHRRRGARDGGESGG